MGRMKDVYIDVMEQYGHIPKDFSLGDYLMKKKQEEYEWEEHEKNMQSEKKDSIAESNQNGDSEQGNGKNSSNAGEESK
jgi:hypothetical protein